MFLYLIRHGEAEDGPEQQRVLTQNGKDGVEQLAQKITAGSEAPALLLASPLIRAIQTAQAYQSLWDVPLEIVDWLLPLAGPSRVLQELKALPRNPVALFGHLPCLGLVLSALVEGLPPRDIDLPKGGAALLQLEHYEPGAAKLEWLLAPEGSE